MRASLSSTSLIRARARFLTAHCVVQRKATLDLKMVVFGLFPFFLAIMNIDAVGNSVYKFLQGYIFNSLGVYIGVELLGHTVPLCLTF